MAKEPDIVNRLRFIYNDMGARISNDDNNSWKIILLSGFLISSLGLIFKINTDISTFQKGLVIFSILFLFSSAFCAFVSILIYRDLRFISNWKWLLAEGGVKAYKNLNTIIKVGNPTHTFHTESFMKSTPSAEAFEQYLEDVSSKVLISDVTEYLFFIANLIEVRKHPRSLALRLLSIGFIFISLLVISLIFG